MVTLAVCKTVSTVFAAEAPPPDASYTTNSWKYDRKNNPIFIFYVAPILI